MGTESEINKPKTDSDVKSDITPKTSIESPRLSVTNSKRASLNGAHKSTRTNRTMELRKQKAQEAELKRQQASSKRKSIGNRQSVTFKTTSTASSTTTDHTSVNSSK